MTHFRNILHNFGFHKLSRKEIDQELSKDDPDITKRTGVPFPEIKYFVGKRWKKFGRDDEARDCFKLFDKREKEYINAGDIKQVFTNYLEFPISENDIRDFIVECGGNPDGAGTVSSQ